MPNSVPVRGELYSDLLVSIWLIRFSETERPAVTEALDAWLAFRDARGQVLSRPLALAFRLSLGKGEQASQAYRYVDDFHEWLVQTRYNSGNPFSPPRR